MTIQYFKTVMLSVMILIACSSAYADPFNWNDNPVYEETNVAIANIYNSDSGLGVSWQADSDAAYGYRIKIYSVITGKYQVYEKPTYETSLEIKGLTPNYIYDFQVFRIESAVPDDDVLIARGIGYYNAGNSKAFYCYSDLNDKDKWDVALAITNKNISPVNVKLHIGETVQTVTVPAMGVKAEMINTFAGKELSGRYIVWIDSMPGVFLGRYQFRRGTIIYAETSE